jgi:exonuclease SbcC
VAERAAVAQAVDDLAKLQEVIGAREEQYAVIGRLSAVANGQSPENPLKLSFQRYMLGAYLDDVLVVASQRLQRMTDGRYTLQRVSGGDKRGALGLDLEVVDAYTGKARHVSTLSGGETFQASLALALGLADVVQAYEGGVKLETVFVDEGFGSLDPDNLAAALDTLMGLQTGGRLVGIISHVADLRDQIDARLEVTRTRSGSTARFIVP